MPLTAQERLNEELKFLAASWDRLSTASWTIGIGTPIVLSFWPTSDRFIDARHLGTTIIGVLLFGLGGWFFHGTAKEHIRSVL